jgi:hypothetical protein
MLQSKTYYLRQLKSNRILLHEKEHYPKKIQVINGQDPLNQSKAQVCTKSQVNTQQSKYE